MIGPLFQKMSPIWVAIPIGPATGGGAVGSLATDPTRPASPPTIRFIQRAVWSAPTATAVGSAFCVYSP